MVSYLAQLKTLRTKFNTHTFFAWPFSYVVVLLLLCSLIPRVFVFFSPLLFSTAVCSLAIYLFIMSERQSATVVVLDDGEESEVRVLQVYDEVNFSIYNNHIEVGCFLIKPENGWMKSGKDGDERIVYAGRLKAEHHYGMFDEDVESMKIDNLAEGAWNYYFGRCSKWNRRRGFLEEESDLIQM